MTSGSGDTFIVFMFLSELDRNRSWHTRNSTSTTNTEMVRKIKREKITKSWEQNYIPGPENCRVSSSETNKFTPLLTRSDGKILPKMAIHLYIPHVNHPSKNFTFLCPLISYTTLHFYIKFAYFAGSPLRIKSLILTTNVLQIWPIWDGFLDSRPLKRH